MKKFYYLGARCFVTFVSVLEALSMAMIGALLSCFA